MVLAGCMGVFFFPYSSQCGQSAPLVLNSRLVPRPHFVRDRYPPIHGLDLHPRFEFASGFHMSMAGADTSEQTADSPVH